MTTYKNIYSETDQSDNIDPVVIYKMSGLLYQ